MAAPNIKTLLYLNEHNELNRFSGGTTGTVLVGTGADTLPEWKTLADAGIAAVEHKHSGDDITSGTVAFARLPTGTGSSQVAIGNHTHALADCTGTLAVGKGGTGATSLTGVLLGNGTNAVTALTSSTTGHVLQKTSSGYGFAALPSHASTGTTYGAASASNYGHAMATSTTPIVAGTAALGSETAKFARGDHVHPAQTSVTGSSGSCTGNAATASAWKTGRTISLTGAVTGTSAAWTGSGNITIATTLSAHDHDGAYLPLAGGCLTGPLTTDILETKGRYYGVLHGNTNSSATIVLNTNIASNAGLASAETFIQILLTGLDENNKSKTLDIKIGLSITSAGAITASKSGWSTFGSVAATAVKYAKVSNKYVLAITVPSSNYVFNVDVFCDNIAVHNDTFPDTVNNSCLAGWTSASSTSATLTEITQQALPVVSHTHALADCTGTLAVGKGGTGATSLTGVLLGNGTSAVTALTSSTTGYVLQKTSSGYGFAALPSHTHSYAGSASAGGAANSVKEKLKIQLNSGTATEYNGSAEKSINITASAIGAAASSHNHSASNINSGTLAAAQGGTGISTYTKGDLLYGSSDSTPVPAKLPIGTANQMLTVDPVNGVPAWDTVPIYFAVCDTAAATTAKVATSIGTRKLTSDTLTAGTVVFVRFTNTNSGAVGSLTLNIDDTGAKPIKQQLNNSATSDLSHKAQLIATNTYMCVYNGTNWVITFNYNNTYSEISDTNLQSTSGSTSGLISGRRFSAALNALIADTLRTQITDSVSTASNGVPVLAITGSEVHWASLNIHDRRYLKLNDSSSGITTSGAGYTISQTANTDLTVHMTIGNGATSNFSRYITLPSPSSLTEGDRIEFVITNLSSKVGTIWFDQGVSDASLYRSSQNYNYTQSERFFSTGEHVIADVITVGTGTTKVWRIVKHSELY